MNSLKTLNNKIIKYKKCPSYPQVPIEYHWTEEEFLSHMCEKAGLLGCVGDIKKLKCKNLKELFSKKRCLMVKL